MIIFVSRRFRRPLPRAQAALHAASPRQTTLTLTSPWKGEGFVRTPSPFQGEGWVEGAAPRMIIIVSRRFRRPLPCAQAALHAASPRQTTLTLPSPWQGEGFVRAPSPFQGEGWVEGAAPRMLIFVSRWFRRPLPRAQAALHAASPRQTTLTLPSPWQPWQGEGFVRTPSPFQGEGWGEGAAPRMLIFVSRWFRRPLPCASSRLTCRVAAANNPHPALSLAGRGICPCPLSLSGRGLG